MATGYLVSLGDGNLDSGDSISASQSNFTPGSAIGSGSWTWSGVWQGNGNYYSNITDTGTYYEGTDGNVYFVPDNWYTTSGTASANAVPAYSQYGGVVSGTSGDDDIDASYSDSQGDAVDDGDAAGPTGDEDTVSAGAGDDNVESGAGNDTVYGGSGDDTLSGGGGDDVIYGDSDPNEANPDPTSINTSNYSDTTSGYTVTAQNVENGSLTAASVNNVSTYAGSIGASGTVSDTDSGVQQQLAYDKASGLSETIIIDFDEPASELSFTTWSLRSSDFGEIGHYAIYNDGALVYETDFTDSTGTGTDTFDVSGHGPFDQIIFTAKLQSDGSDGSDYGLSDITFTPYVPDPEPGDDDIQGGDGNDIIYGEQGDDSLKGNDGADRLDGGEGNDTLKGGAGDDTLAGGEGADRMRGGSGQDTADYSSSDEGVNVDLENNTASGGDAQGDDYGSIEGVIGSDHDDTISGSNSDDNVIYGGDGDDLLYGLDGNDALYGEAGDDTLFGGTGSDSVAGGAGDDQINVAQGDTVSGGEGDDYFTLQDLGEAGNDSISITGGEGGETAGDTLQLTSDISFDDITFTDTDDANGGLSGHFTMADGTFVSFSEIENIICFTSGTKILTKFGERDIDTLRTGDMVVTRDHGLQPIRWIGRKTVAGQGKFAPISVGSAIAGGDQRSLLVSPQHRILFTGYRAELLFGTPEVLVAAKHLVNGTDVQITPCDQITYIHIMFDRHEVIYAQGIATESFHAGDTGLAAISEPAREELFSLFPELRSCKNAYGGAARTCLKKHQAALLAQP